MNSRQPSPPDLGLAELENRGDDDLAHIFAQQVLQGPAVLGLDQVLPRTCQVTRFDTQVVHIPR